MIHLYIPYVATLNSKILKKSVECATSRFDWLLTDGYNYNLDTFFRFVYNQHSPMIWHVSTYVKKWNITNNFNHLRLSYSCEPTTRAVRSVGCYLLIVNVWNWQKGWIQKYNDELILAFGCYVAYKHKSVKNKTISDSAAPWCQFYNCCLCWAPAMWNELLKYEL